MAASGNRASRRAKPQTGPRAEGAKPASSQQKKSKREEAMDTEIRVDGVGYKLGDLTLGELSELEDHTGLPMDAISYGSAKTIMFVVYLVRRRADPSYSLDDAGKIEIRKVESDEPEVAAEVGEAGPTEASSD